MTFDKLSGSHHQMIWNRKGEHVCLNLTSAQVVETSVSVNSNIPPQNFTHPDDHTSLTYVMSPGFKTFTVLDEFVTYV